jgi:alkylation response protein AidB-like acyl-CoA dehydrogenase
VDFELTEDQEALQDGTRSLCEGRFDMATVRSLADSDGVDRARWSELADTGVFSLVLPEADGGVGLRWADATIVFEELGRAAVPGPLVGSFLAAGLVDGAATGEKVVGIVQRAAPPVIIEYLGAVDALLVYDDAGVALVDASELTAAVAQRPLDPLTPVSVLDSALPEGEPVGSADAARLLATRGAILTSALHLGLAEAATDLAVDYAKERRQFDKPIGQFQAVKHMCADMLSHVEVARAAVYMAGVTLDDALVGDPERAASTARIVAGEAAQFCGKSCIQVHGGMGYTWEVDAHIYLKRAWALDLTFGTADEHAEALAELV